MPPGKRPLAVVTGANRGLGREVCRQLAATGYEAILTGRDPVQGAAAAAQLSQQGLAVVFRPLDVTDDASAARLADDLTRTGAVVDVLVNNAAIAMKGFNAEVARRTVDTNFYGAARVTDALLPHFAAGARVVMVSSGLGQLSAVGPALKRRFTDAKLTRAGLAALVEQFVADVAADRHGREGWPSSAYNVSKVALNALTRLLVPTLKKRGVLVNAVCPGWVRTDMGGRGASRSIEEGANSIVWAAALGPDGPTGGFFRDGHKLAW
jgi:NAD(P)-dependent dehydrogenase (short-subunit alcohol dehydrogenase family)